MDKSLWVLRFQIANISYRFILQYIRATCESSTTDTFAEEGGHTLRATKNNFSEPLVSRVSLALL